MRDKLEESIIDLTTRQECGACRALEGELHQSECGMERCGECGGQMVGIHKEGCSIDRRKKNGEILPNDLRDPYIFLVVRCICDRCGEFQPEMFKVEDSEWKDVIPREVQDKALCLGCYTLFKAWRGKEEKG